MIYSTKPAVLFFGGYKSTEEDVDNWVKSAMEQKPDYNFFSFHYPPDASASDPLVKVGNRSKVIAASIKQQPNTFFTIVGHSSGCAISNDVAEKALQIGAQNFRLVALDGFRPSEKLLEHQGTACWSAQNGSHRSLNYSSLHNVKCFHVFEAKVTSLWPLHFSLVNTNVLDSHPSISEGYYNVRANLEWMT